MSPQTVLGLSGRFGAAFGSGLSGFSAEDGSLTVHVGDCLGIMRALPSGLFDLVLTSPPYNIGKEYEKKMRLNDYLSWHSMVIDECWRLTKTNGSECWQVGDYVDRGEIVPLDLLLYPYFKRRGFVLRN